MATEKIQREASRVRNPQLLTLSFSHYCERARWALDYQEIAYDERRLPPILHSPYVRRLGAPTSSLPLLLLADGSLLQGSSHILDWTGLAGGDEAIERRLERVTAPRIRQWLYAGLLTIPQSGIRNVLFRGTMLRHPVIASMSWPPIRKAIAIGTNASPERLPEIVAQLERELDWFDRLLAERGNHLVGQEFGRADLSAASFWAPIALPQTEPVMSIFSAIRWPSSLASFIENSSERQTIRWVRRIYEAYRATAISGSGNVAMTLPARSCWRSRNGRQPLTLPSKNSLQSPAAHRR